MRYNKLNKFEAGIVEDSLNLWCDKFIDEIQYLENQGKNCLFHPEYPKAIKNDIMNKLRDLTKKR